MNTYRIQLLKKFGVFVAAIISAMAITCGFASCSAVYDDLDECPRGVEMRFIFDYNLEFANSFPSQVDCLSVYVFNEAGDLVERREEVSEKLADEDWRLTFDLPAGDYTAIAYGGLDCEENSFAHIRNIDDIQRLEDLEVLINEEHVGTLENMPEKPLHDFFHGKLNFTVKEGMDYDRETMEMVRNTNHLRIALQHVDGSPVDVSDFRFEVLDDNVRFDHANNVIPHKLTTFVPWSLGNAVAGVQGEEEPGVRADEGMPVQVAYAEMSLSRLIYRSNYTWTKADGETRVGPRLRITNVKDDHTVVDIPLNSYLLLMKSDYFRNMDNQEYLDRSYRHNFVFFLDSANEFWVNMHIIVGEWTVRIDNIDL